MTNTTLVDATGAEMGQDERQEGQFTYIDWKSIGQWALAAILSFFLWSINSQASELKASVHSLDESIQNIRVDMSNRITRLETLQALQAERCK